MKAKVQRAEDGWVAVVRGPGASNIAQKALAEACARMRGDGIEVTSLDVQSTAQIPRRPRVVRSPSMRDEA